MTDRKPTMRDIARELGTSAVTVSKAMAGKPGMSDELRSRILKKASEMGYAYPADKTRKELEIGILIPDRHFQPESFYAEIFKQLVKKLTDLGHFGLLEILGAGSEKALILPNLLDVKHVDGLILLGEPDKAYYRKVAQAGTPVVFLDFYDEQANADAVTGDNAYGTYRLTSHLIRNGHRKIGFFGSKRATSSIMDRFLGYIRAMIMNDLEIRSDWILPDRDEAGRLIAPALPEEMPTAFVCNCDVSARILIRQLQEEGYRVPDDISVTGYDDYPQGGMNDVPLSTYRNDTDGMIDLAVRTLLDRCAGEQKPFSRFVVSGQPIYRSSEIPFETGR